VLIYLCIALNTLQNRYHTSFLSKRPLTTVRSRFSADELHIVRGEVEDTFGISSSLNRLLTVVRGHFGRKNEYRFIR